MEKWLPETFCGHYYKQIWKKNYPSTQSNEVCTVVIPYDKEFQTNLNVFGINITLRPFLKQSTLYVIYLYEQNQIPSLNYRYDIAFTVSPVNAGEVI
jgi:hypothetical protein